MKHIIALALSFIAMLAALGAWHAFSSPKDVAMSDVPDEPSALVAPPAVQQGGSVAQVVEKVIPKGPLAPEIASSTWLNSAALATQDLRGRVVVVEFWTHG